MPLVDTIRRICELQPSYSSDNTPAMQERGALIRHDLRDGFRSLQAQLAAALGPLSAEFDVDASDGIGRKTEAPWVRIFARSLSPAATSGFYVVMHFKRDGTGFYVTVGCGSTVWKNGDLIEESAEALKKRTDWARGAIIEKFGTLAPFSDAMALGAKASLPRTFERATAMAKELSPATATEAEVVDLLVAATERLREIYLAQQTGRDVTPADIDAEEVEKVAKPLRPRLGGQGVRLSAEDRKAIETRAMLLAREWLEAHSFDITDFSMNSSYDYKAVNASTTYKIEVKGTTSDGNDEVLMTRNEVELHRTEKGATGLIIVSKIRLDRSSGKVVAGGGEIWAELGWDIDEWTLSPMAFRVSRNGATVSSA